MEGELQEVYVRACACASKEVELVAACFVYRVRHSEQARVKVSKDVLSALEAAGCAARKKVSACSLGMFLCHQQQQSTAQRPPETNEERDYFGDWGKGLGSFEGQEPYGGFIEKVVAELQARHEKRTQGGTRHQNKNLSLRKMYSVFGKWTGQTKSGASAAPQPPSSEPSQHLQAAGGSLVTLSEMAAHESKATGSESTATTTKRKLSATGSSRRQSPSSSDEPSPPKRSKHTTTTIPNNDSSEESEEEEDDEEEEPEGGRVWISYTRRRRRTGQPTHTVRATTTLSRNTKQAQQSTQTKKVSPKPSPSSSALQKEKQVETDGEGASQEPAEKHKLRSPFRPPSKEMRRGPCWSKDDGKTWQSLSWDKRHQISKEAWIQPIRKFFLNEREVMKLKEEDRGDKVKWRQDFETCYGVRWPVRHLDTFMAAPEVEASVSHQDTGKAGYHLVLEKCGNIDAFTVRKTLISRLNKEWKKDLGPNGCNFNAIQSNLYSGSFQNDDVSSLDTHHIGFHKDGRCKIRGPPIVSGCYSNNDTGEDNVAAFLIHHQQEPIRVWIPQQSGTGYAFGGRHCHKKYYHGKFLFGDWKAYHHHVSITFSCYHPSTKKQAISASLLKRGTQVDVDWQLTAASRLWTRKYLLGQVPKAACHPEIRRLNQECIITSNYESVWGPWDEFKNTSILQLLHLHPADGGQGIAGNKEHALSLLIMGTSKQYPNEVTVDRNSKTIAVKYYASDRGKRLLKKAKRDRILLRVFLSPKMPARQLFSGQPASILYLPLMTVQQKAKDVQGVFVLLSALLVDDGLKRLKD